MFKVTRRQFVRASGLMTAGAIAAACAPKTPTAAPTALPKATAAPTAAAAAATKAPAAAVATTAPTAAAAAATKAPAATTAPAAAAKYGERPTFAELVKAGKLPPVEQRLPATPLVAEGLDGVGKYGGTWRRGYSGQADGTNLSQIMGRGLLKIQQDFKIVPYTAEAYEVSADATEFTFKLRKGLKWSDGQPLTSKDVVYWFENVVKDTEITKATPAYLASMVDGKLVFCTVTAPDDFTVKFKFPKPASLFYYRGEIVNGLTTAQPQHYMKQFHMKLGDKAFIEKEMAAGSFKTWVDLYNEKNNRQYNPARPTNEPWVQVNTWRDELVNCAPNPYFFVVDKQGNQLPYIEKISLRNYQAADVLALWLTNGEIDCQARGFGFEIYTVLKENEKKGDYALQMWKWSAVMCLHFNMTTKEPKLRELFSARDFRIAMSVGINRDEINQLNYDGLATPMQYAPPKGTPQYYEKLTNAYLTYDAKKADELLNNLGYKKGPDGMRMWKDGSGKISWTILGGTPQGADSMAVIDQMKKLGFDVVYKGVDRSLQIALHNSNDVEASLTNADRALIPLADPQVWIKHTNKDDRPWCNAWTIWKMDPKDPVGEEPPKDHWIWTIWNTYDQMWQTADVTKRDDMFKSILEIWATELPSIGVLGLMPKPIVVKNGFKGIKAGYDWDCCSTNYEHIIDCATWYWDDPTKHV